jgi:hypothetical protein
MCEVLEGILERVRGQMKLEEAKLAEGLVQEVRRA